MLPRQSAKQYQTTKNLCQSESFDSNYDSYKAAYGSMPTHASTNDQIKQLYVDVHFCYAYKIGIVTNGLGIVRHLDFYNKDFLNAHPELVPNKKSDSPDEDKSIHDARLLIPTLQDFSNCHPLINLKTFLGDATFDSVAVYKDLLSGTIFNGNHFSKAYIPLNSRSHLKNKDYSINEFGIPCCLNDPSLHTKPEGKSKLRSGVERFKFVCPKMTFDKCDDGKYRRICHCSNPCTSSRCGRMVYLYPEKDLRSYPGTLRGTDEWSSTYKIRTTVERSINHFKNSFGLANRKTQNEKNLHADLILAGVTQLIITVVLADKIHQHQYIRSIKPLIA